MKHGRRRGTSSGYGSPSDVSSGLCGLRKGATDGSELDVREDHLRVGAGALDIGWHTAGDVALAASNTRLLRILVCRVIAVQPEHVGVVVVPETHYEYHTQVHTPTHGCHATELVEGVDLLLENFLLRVAPFLSDGVAFLVDC